MTLNLHTFKTRTITALFFVVVMLAGLLINHWIFFILFSVIHFGCWAEYQHLISLADKNYLPVTPFHKYGVMLAGWCILLYFSSNNYHLFGLYLHEAGWWLGLMAVFLLPVMELLFNPNIRLKNIGYSAAGLLYISLSLGLMINMSTHSGYQFLDTGYTLQERSVPVFIIGCLWINDTMAYLTGSWIGKRKLSKISPKKTWEGTLGGLILTIAAAGVLAWQLEFPLLFLMAPAGIIAVSGIAGDLLESKLKRIAGVKDSGTILPGHGGFLDRFDSLLVAVPFTWLYIQVFLK